VAQIHSIKRRLTPSGKPQFDAEYAGRGHADRFWALALACRNERGPGPDDVVEFSARIIG
jgi:phage FluMu gp28-like protein